MKNNEHPWVQIAPGIRRQTITAGARMYQMRAELAAGSTLPEHHHAQEQITHVLIGRLRFKLPDRAQEVAANESIYLAGNVAHAVEALEDSVVLDTFSPSREDYLAADRDSLARDAR